MIVVDINQTLSFWRGFFKQKRRFTP